MRIVSHLLLSQGSHSAPAGERRLDTHSDKAQESLGENEARDGEGGLYDNDTHGIRDQMAGDDLKRRRTQYAAYAACND